jgi:hypothetical protein
MLISESCGYSQPSFTSFYSRSLSPSETWIGSHLKERYAINNFKNKLPLGKVLES